MTRSRSRTDDAVSSQEAPAGRPFDWTPARVTALYLLLGVLALFLSDVLLVRVLSEPVLSRVQAVKGVVEVLLTGGFIYVLTRRSRANFRRTNEELVRQREELTVLHRVLRHNLRNELTVVAGTAEHIRHNHANEAEVVAQCERIERRGARMAALVEQARRIRRVTDRADPVVRIDLRPTVREAIETVDTSGATLTVSIPADERVAVNWLFEDALAEVIDNAIEHADGDHPTVHLDADVGDEFVTVTVTDDGPGMPDSVRAVFNEGEFDQLLHVDGLGLWFAYWTVTDAGGSFEIPDDESGTTVQLELRRAPSPGSGQEKTVTALLRRLRTGIRGWRR